MFGERVSMRLHQATLLALACSMLVAAGAQAQPFSADIVTRDHDVSRPAGRLSVRDGKVRIDASEHPDGFFLVDSKTPSAWFVRPASRVFMDAKQSSRLTQVFVPVDPDAPCRQWQAMAHLAGSAGQGDWRCEQTGEETIDGRDAVAVRAVPDTGEPFVGWIDRTRKFPLRIKTADGSLLTLENIRDEALPETSFEIPANARKFSPEALIERIKQSDVWVAGPEER
jgi:hypothetical protein